jgi:hypothetical protein
VQQVVELTELAGPGVLFDNTAAPIAGETRHKTLTALARGDEWAFSPHFPFPGVGHVIAAGLGFAWKPGLP